MARTPLRVVRDAAARIASYVGPSGEPVFNADTRRLHMQDGVTAGGHPLALLSEVPKGVNDLPGLPDALAARAYQPAYKSLVIFGSSNGAGMGASSYTGDPTEANGWASPPTSAMGLLTAALKQHDVRWQAFNRSISGSGVIQSLDRFYTDVAPHRPSHVILGTHPKNDGYDVQRYLRGTELLCRMCDAIGAVPIIRGAYPDNAMSADEYNRCLALNAALDTLGRNRIDHMSIMDDGAGHIVGGSAYHIGDGLHLNDAGQELQFRAIDVGLFTYGASMRFADADRGFAWQIAPATTTGTAIVLNASAGLLNPPRSLTMRARVRSGPGSTTAVAPLSAYAQGLGTEADQNNIVRIRAANGPYALADVGGVIGPNSNVNPRSDGTTVRDLVMVVDAAANRLSFFIDGVLISSGAPNAALVPCKVFAIGGRAEPGNAFPASGLAIAGAGIWNVPLSATAVAEMYRTGRLPPAGLIYGGVLSGAPSAGGIVPNVVRNSLVGRLGEAPWQTVPNI